MEQAGMADKANNRTERVYERLGWMLLAAGAVLGILAAVITALPPLYWFTDPRFQSLYPIMTAWSITWLGFNVFALLLALIPYKRGERWSWYALWMLPLLWLSLFALAPDLRFYLVPAIISAVGLLLPYRRFLFGPEQQPARLR